MLAKLKWYLIAIVVLALISFTVWFNIVLKQNAKLKADKFRLEYNQSQLLSENSRTIQLELSLKEFKASISRKIDSILKVAEIASKQVKTITEIHNYYIDSSKTVIQPAPVISKNDTIYPFSDMKGCIGIEGFLMSKKNIPSLTLTKRVYSGDIALIGYWQRPHRFWFIKYGKKENTIQAFPECGEVIVKKIDIVKKK
jgi:hypothetical protein